MIPYQQIMPVQQSVDTFLLVSQKPDWYFEIRSLRPVQFNQRSTSLIESTTQDVPGREIIEILGVVRGNSVRARHVGRDIMAGLRNIVGGEIPEYAQLQAETREMATRRMTEQAESMGADAVVMIRYTTSMITTGASEILAYGTAVKLS